MHQLPLPFGQSTIWQESNGTIVKETGMVAKTLAPILLFIFFSQCTSNVPDLLAPERVLYNGKIVTVDQDFSIAQAVAIREGRFVAVGSDSEILALAGAQTEKVDLEGKTI